MKHYLIILSLLLFLAMVSTSCTQETPNKATEALTMEAPVSYPPNQSGTFVELTAVQAKALVDGESNLMIIDVSSNYDDGHIPGAVNYYVSDGSLERVIPTLDKTKIYFVCAHVDGYGSAIAVHGAEKLADAGFEKVYALAVNQWKAWVDAGYPVEK